MSFFHLMLSTPLQQILTIYHYKEPTAIQEKEIIPQVQIISEEKARDEAKKNA